MARPRDIVRWLTGFIGYAALPRPDLRQEANRLKTATNVWVGGDGTLERRGGMSLAAVTSNPYNSHVMVPARYGDSTYSLSVVYDGLKLSNSTVGVVANFHDWTYTFGHFSQAPDINGKAHLIVSAPLYTPTIFNANRAAFTTPAAPTGADSGSGTYHAVLRYYRLQWTNYSANEYDIRGTVGPALSFTPSGSGTGVVITRPTAGAGASHWLLWGSVNDREYYLITRVAIATTTYTDTTPGASESALANAYLALNDEPLTDDLMGTPVRQVGMIAVDGVPTVADQGSGAYAATLRYYRVRWTEVINGVTRRRGEPSRAVSFTPSGSGDSCRVTRPTAPAASWGATHWELEASTDDATFYVLGATVISATTRDDDATSYGAFTTSETTGDYTVPPNARTAVADRDRMIFGGGWTEHFSRIWYTPVLGTTDVSDDERVPLRNYLDIEATDDDEIRALVGPIFGSILVFKRRSIFRLTRTGDADAPYDVLKIAEGIGCDNPNYVCLAPGPTGEEAVYFINTLGAWRYDAVGGAFTRLNNDLASSWEGDTTPTGRVVYYPTRHAVLFGEYAYNITTGGWTWQDWTYGNAAAQAVARVLPVSSAVPLLYMPSSGCPTEGLYLCDYASSTTDAETTAYSATVRTNRFSLAPETTRWRPVRVRVWGTGGNLQLRLFDNTGSTPLATHNLTLGSNQDAVNLTELFLSGPVEWLSIEVRDGTSPSVWQLDALEVTGIPQGPIP